MARPAMLEPKPQDDEDDEEPAAGLPPDPPDVMVTVLVGERPLSVFPGSVTV